MTRIWNLTLLFFAIICLSCEKDSTLDTSDEYEPKDTTSAHNDNQNESSVSTDTTDQLSSIKINITNFKSSKGVLLIGLYNSAEDFPQKDKTYKAKIVDAEEERVETEIDSIPAGTYALSLHHDKNENGKIDQNALGIPQEGFGFSNNASGTFGPPKYERTKFQVEQNSIKELDIKLNHY